MDVDRGIYLSQNLFVHISQIMTLSTKFKKDISILQAAVNKEFYLDVKNPKLYKKIRRYYESKENIEFTGEDPDADYNVVMNCITQDLKEEL